LAAAFFAGAFLAAVFFAGAAFFAAAFFAGAFFAVAIISSLVESRASPFSRAVGGEMEPLVARAEAMVTANWLQAT
jgi:hypothetical protein